MKYTVNVPQCDICSYDKREERRPLQSNILLETCDSSVFSGKMFAVHAELSVGVYSCALSSPLHCLYLSQFS